MKSNFNCGLLGIAFAAITTAILSGSAAAQIPLSEISSPETVAEKPASEPNAIAIAPQLVDAIPSSSDLSGSQPTAAEMRQARAQYRAQQRMERMERNLWAGYEPLRPNA